MKIPLINFPLDIISRYNLISIVHNGFVYTKIKKGIHGLKKVAILVYEKLVCHLQPYKYAPPPFSLGLWTHASRRTTFCLCVDDFGVKKFCRDDADHLLNALQQVFKVAVGWEGGKYYRLSLAWNYDKQYVNVSMPKYIPQMLQKFNPPPPKPQLTPHQWTVPTYVQKQQYVKSVPELPQLSVKLTNLLK